MFRLQPISIFFIAIFSLWVLTSPAEAKPLATVYKATLIRVIDGDTMKLRLEIYPGLFKEVNLRIEGIDTPESRRGKKAGKTITDCEITLGQKAKSHAQKLLSNSPLLKVTDLDPAKSKYAGRINGKLWFVPLYEKHGTAVNYGLYMIHQKLAQPYEGGTREPWPCSP
ncbi:thermonuclease family protein [Marinomonas balearica]|uniref:Endonuclease YncB(Thermonuclease family) n=1 Tax=Marinomonas balearica TaxID=491947 RepID=A0A4R6M5Q1_9GAMM|nr:thermonuclease family protein [Marinomonas balearica]TDO96681.1 endonuclease YncB(thermonuclease family) [Marinomonas balearica]